MYRHLRWKSLRKGAASFGAACRGAWVLGLRIWVLAILGTSPLPASEEIQGRLAELTEQLKSEDVELRRAAAYELNGLGKAAEPAVGALTEALEDRDTQVWFQAVSALAEIGPAADPATPVLLEGLRSDGRGRQREQVWYRSAYALSRVGPAVLPALREATRSEDFWVRAGAAKAIGWQGSAAAEAIPELAALLADEQADVRSEALEALAEIGAVAVPALVATLDHEQPDARRAAVRALGMLGLNAGAAVQPLLLLWERDSDPRCRAALMTALRRTGCDPEQLAGMLVEALKLDDGPEREAAVNNLMVLPDPARTVVPRMRDFLASADERDRTVAANILGRLGSPAAELAPELIALARDRPAGGEGESCPFRTALQEIGWPAWPALCQAAAGEELKALGEGHWATDFVRGLALSGTETLTEALSDARAPVRLLALHGLETVAAQARFAYDAAAAQLDDSEPAIRARALRTAAAMRPEGRKLHALLQRGFEDPSAEVRAAAVAGVQSLDSDPEVSLPLLLTAMSDSDPSVQLEGIRAMGAFGAQAAIAVGPLRARIGEDNPHATRIAALEALAAIGSGAAEASPEIAACVEQGVPEVRAAALSALGGLGSSAAGHLPLVESALEAPEPTVRAAAVAAYVRMEMEKEKTLPRLEQALADAAFEVRKPAIEALGSIGQPARPAAERLFALLGEGTDRPLVLSALREIRPRDVTLYVSILEHPEAEVRRFACGALGRMGKEATEAAPKLRERLRDEYDFVRDAAREALRRIEEQS